MMLAAWDESPDDPDHDDFAHQSWDEQTDTMTCPACGAEIYEDAPQCPVCGDYIVPDTSIWTGKPMWWIALGIVGIIALAAALVLGF